MKTRTRDFPGADHETNDRLARDVAVDEKAIIDEILELWRKSPMSLEAYRLSAWSRSESDFTLPERHVKRHPYQLFANCTRAWFPLPGRTRSGRYDSGEHAVIGSEDRTSQFA